MTTLLIVDDSSVSRMMIKGRVVGLQPDWQIVEASTGAAAIEMVTADYPDFISMDVNMPGMSGFEAIERIRLINSKAKIVVLTANIQESSKEKEQPDEIENHLRPPAQRQPSWPSSSRNAAWSARRRRHGL